MSGSVPIVPIPDLGPAGTAQLTDLIIVCQGGVAKQMTVGAFFAAYFALFPTSLPASAGVPWNNEGPIQLS
jgi:hypothetical protein